MSNVIEINVERQIEFSDFLMEKRGEIYRMQKIVEGIHADVNQMYGALPYSFHTNMVAMMFMQYGSVCFASRQEMEDYGLVAVFGAFFHDTIEDARMTYGEVEKYAQSFLPPNLVGADKAELAADIVFALTNEKGKTRAERENDKYFEGILSTPYAPCIKMCDRYVNTVYANATNSSMSRKYRSEMAKFLEKLTFENVDENESLRIPKELYMALQMYPMITNSKN